MSDPVTPNMSLIQPITGVTAGSTANDEFNSNWSTLDSHDHSPGRGAPITPSGFTINTDLLFNGNNATLLRSCRFSIQSTTLVGSDDLACVYFSGSDFWVNDTSGTAIKITSGGAVNATSSGISSGTATASFVGSVLVVNAASNKPANIQGASLLLGNNVTSSKYLTLSPPNSMAADYALVLPAIPATTTIMTVDTSGNMAGSYTIDNSTLDINGSNQIEVKTGGIGQAQVGVRATSSSSVAAGGIISVAISVGGTPITTVIDITSTFQIVTLGNPLLVCLQGGGNGIVLERASPGDQIQGGITLTDSSNTFIGDLNSFQVEAAPGSNAGLLFFQSVTATAVIPIAAGTHTLKFRGSAAHGTLFVAGTITVMELK